MNEKKTKNIPQRKCISCGLRKNKGDLLRLVRNTDGSISIDSSGKLNGRGAYICKDMKCVDEAINKNKISYALKTKVPNSLYEEIKKYVLDS